MPLKRKDQSRVSKKGSKKASPKNSPSSKQHSGFSNERGFTTIHKRRNVGQ